MGIALQHNLGLGGAVVVALYKLYQQPTTKKMGSIDESTKDLKSALIFDGIAEALENDGANLVKKVKGIFGFKIKDVNGKEHLWIVDAKNGSGKVEFNGKGIFFKPYPYHHSPVKKT